MLTKKQSKQFLDWYHDRYGDIKELPIIYSRNEETETQVWIDKLREILGKEADKLYKIRRRGEETILTKVFNDLRLNYGPTIKEGGWTFTQYTPETLRVPEGRHKIIIEYFDRIQAYIDMNNDKDFHISYLKEKYGSLRVERWSATPRLSNQCTMLEEATETICQVCGKKGKIRSDLFRWSCLCFNHYLPRKLRQLWIRTKNLLRGY